MIERVDDLLFVQTITARNRLRGVDRESADEHREPAEHDSLGFAQVAVAPVEQRLQRLMTRMRSAAPLPMQPEALLEEVRGSPDAVGCDAPRGEFDRERDPIQSAADAGDRSAASASLESKRLPLAAARSMKSFTAGNSSTSAAFRLELGAGLASGGSQ